MFGGFVFGGICARRELAAVAWPFLQWFDLRNEPPDTVE
jgi:hypothetical protein